VLRAATVCVGIFSGSASRQRHKISFQGFHSLAYCLDIRFVVVVLTAGANHRGPLETRLAFTRG